MFEAEADKLCRQKSESTLGFPGEGPPFVATNNIIGTRRPHVAVMAPARQAHVGTPAKRQRGTTVHRSTPPPLGLTPQAEQPSLCEVTQGVLSQ
eukprot:scaffold11840_cov133-Isochrysis_galbana.AAC.2